MLKPLGEIMNKQLKLTAIALVALTVPMLSASAGEKPFPKIIPVLEGAPPEGFAIGKGTTAYNGSIDGSIYKFDLRTGIGELFVAAEPGFDAESVFAGECYKLGMRVDRRSNNLIVAGCAQGDAYVFDADTGEELKKYQLDDSGNSVINDLAITTDAVYFTDYNQPFIYRLPVSKNGRLPEDVNAATAIELTGDFETGENLLGVFANGIVATPDGKTLIVGNSGSSKLFRVDPTTGHSDEIIIDPPLNGLVQTGVDEDGFPILDGAFLDALVMRDGVLYVLGSGFNTPEDDGVFVVVLADDLLTGTNMGTITDPETDFLASGALHGDSLYLNNARYFNFPGCLPEPDGCTQYWITKVNIYDIGPVE
jgi:sugar lactone lactonase YvrE